jgi:hypothetical protein
MGKRRPGRTTMMFSGDETGYGSFNPPPFIQPGVTPPTETKPAPQITTGSAGMTPEQIAELQKRFEGYKPEEIKRVADVGPEEMKDILARRQSALAGFQAPELAAMQAQMAVTGAKWCDFVSFDPRMPERSQLLVVRVMRDPEYILYMEAEISSFLKEVEKEVQLMEKRNES